MPFWELDLRFSKRTTQGRYSLISHVSSMRLSPLQWAAQGHRASSQGSWAAYLGLFGPISLSIWISLDSLESYPYIYSFFSPFFWYIIYEWPHIFPVEPSIHYFSLLLVYPYLFLVLIFPKTCKLYQKIREKERCLDIIEPSLSYLEDDWLPVT